MPDEEKNISKNTLVLAVFFAIILTAIIVGIVVFAWQNSTLRKDQVFMQQLQEQELSSLERQIEILKSTKASDTPQQ